MDTDEETENPTALQVQLTRTNSIRETVTLFPPIQEVLFVTVICMSQFMTQVALGACLSPLTIIGDSFSITNPVVLSWLIAGYSLTVGTFILFFGRCGDLFGYRTVYILGFIWFTVWSMVAGLSVYSNHVLFISARTLQGLGPAMLLTNGLALLGAAYPPGKKKHMVFALFSAMAPNGALLGAVFAAIISQLCWWPWTFWSMAIYCLLLAIIGVFVIPAAYSPVHGMEIMRIVKELDLIGSVLGITGLVLVNLAWNQAPVVGWEQPYVYIVLIVGFLFLLAFFIVETRFSPKPLIPFDALNVDVSFIYSCIFGIWLYYFWQFLENIRALSPLLSVAQFSPVAPVGILAAFTTGALMSRLHPGWIMSLAMLAFTLGNILAAIAPADQTYWALTFVSLLVMPWGMDMSFPAATIILSDAVGSKHQGVAASFVTTIVNYSISLGLGFAGTVEVHVNNGGLDSQNTLKGYRGANYMGIGLGGLGVAVSLIYLVKSFGGMITGTKATQTGEQLEV
ncbi:MFS general substrate transporter [Aspergillus eucalypticola CBS 122712]|uniref:MFS general substrate transporter n=1 Tax=Aspergillus eucalypticola (strain CBS 122712 / IBT 29274) TaxID=1448314 RepID=A0A317UVC2_ASPEC|nr:MFS general substrate transporter [Aspergillus eucalypticola CBS 122712]PWY65386.1 MFS general substrate transporter [Aspergillus eucalypticola CBS 122712]